MMLMNFARTGARAVAVMAVVGLGTLLPFAASAEETAAPAAPIEIKDFALGPDDAKVKIVEYASFTCPHCAAFHAESFGPLKAEYIDTGKVRFEYREVYFDQPGLWAAMVARCGGELRYFGMTDIYFDTQKEWAGVDDPAQIAENLRTIGRTAGMDDATLDACLKDQPMAEALVAHFQKNLETDFPNDSFKGTPTLIINGVEYSNMAYADLKAIIDAELAK